MLDMRVVVERMLIVLILMAVGFVARKTGRTDAVANQKLSHIIINVAQCGMILGAVMNAELGITRAQALGGLGISFGLMALFLCIGYLTPVLLRAKGETRGTYRFMSAFGNTGFIGMPIIGSVFGREAVLLVALFNIPFNLSVYTLGMAMISGGEHKVRFSLKALLSPPVVASLLALLIFLFDIPFPTVVADAAVTLGELVLPGCLLVLGGSLGAIPLKEVFNTGRVYLLLFIKHIAEPVIVWAILRPFISDPLVLGTFTLIASMPIAAASTMLSIEYGGDEVLATKSVFLSSLASVGTIPLIAYLLLR